MTKLLSLGLDTGAPVELSGKVNVTPDALLANVAFALREGHPQVRPSAPNHERILLVGGGPSLAATERELIDLYFAGAKVAAVNGAYAWCLARNIRPSVQIVVDARAHNARFVEPAVPDCTYLLASQCAPETWTAVRGRDRVWIWHALGEGDEALTALLDAYYLRRWHAINGGTTVAVRALMVLRTLGFMQYDLFGIDSCWGPAGDHHAYPQPENDADKHLAVRLAPEDGSSPGREFWVAPWHLAQLENFLHLVRHGGHQFGRITVHGDGMLAYAMNALGGEIAITQEG